MKKLAFCILLAACATTGADGHGDVALPSAGVGPFRKLDTSEVQGVAPFVLDDAIALYGEPATLVENDEVVLFVSMADGAGRAIARSRASDGRSFFGASGDVGHAPEIVLRADQAWEGKTLGGPFVMRRGTELLLYYAAEGGLGLARSTDGHAFRKDPGPIVPAPARAPGGYVDAANRVHIFFGRETDLHETIDGGPPSVVFSPAAIPAVLEKNEKPPFDTAAVDDPFVVTRTTPAGRFVVQVLYTGRIADGTTAIGLAARYGDEGPLDRQALPVYSIGQHEAAPAFAATRTGTYLYVQQEKRTTSGTQAPYPGIAGAFAPADQKAPGTSSYPPSP